MITKNSQTSMEFIILVGVLLFFFTLFFIFIQGNMSDKIRNKKDISMKEIALIVQNEIDLAFGSDDGYYRQFNIPNDIEGDNYNITLIENLVYIKTNDGKHAISIPVKKINGQIIKNNNIIRKYNGEVYLNV